MFPIAHITMIIYSESCGRFISQCLSNPNSEDRIGKVIADRMKSLSIGFSEGSLHSWEYSLPFLARTLRDNDVPLDADISIEYRLDPTRYRVDALISGTDGMHEQVVIIELKQWSTASYTSKPNFVHTFGGDGEGDYWHPSYQAANYAGILENFNAYVQDGNVSIHTCAYLHNMAEENEILLDDEVLYPAVSMSPVFLRNEEDKLANFIKKFIKGPKKELLYRIEKSEIRPSVALAEMLSSSLKGNDFFSYSDDQADAVSTIVQYARDSAKYGEKRTILIKGGPGTGKSIVAINAMGQLISPKSGKSLNAAYFTSNSAPRLYYSKQLIGENYTKIALKNLFRSPVSLASAPENTYACSFFDEAHRMFDWKGGTGLKKGINVVEKAIKASKVSVFFIDEDQAVTIHDYATEQIIRDFAEKCGSKVINGPVLRTQFRVLGGNAYPSFIRHILGYPDNDYCPGIVSGYDFKIFDTASEMREALRLKNAEYGKSRMVAGYDYEWKTKKDHDSGYDIILDGGAFKAKWNMNATDYSWLFDDSSFDDVGCIHTCQGLDMQYCAVIIGPDMLYTDTGVTYNQSAIAKSDRSSGIRTLKDNDRATRLLRNTYNVLLTRGMRGTFVYCEDNRLSKYIRSEWNKICRAHSDAGSTF